MIVKEEFLKKLRSYFDLNIYEVKIWAAILSRGIASAGELSDISDVPRSRSYDVLESLEKKGFVMMKLGKPIKYIAIKPEDILKRIKEGIKTDATTKISFLDDVKNQDTFSELELLYTQGVKKIDPYSLSGAIKGRDNIYNHLRLMLEGAKKNVAFMTTQEGLQRKAKKYKGILQKLKDKGVELKFAATVTNPKTFNVEHITPYGPVKPVQNMNARFVIIDDEQALIMVCGDNEVHESYDTAIWVKTPYFVKAFSDMFNTHWNELK